MTEPSSRDRNGLAQFFSYRLRPLRRTVIIVAELSALGGAAAFLVATLVGSFIFARWELSYLQIASPSDIVIGGLHLLVSIIFLFIFYAAGIMVGAACFNNKFIMSCALFIIGCFWSLFLYFAQKSISIIPNQVIVPLILLSCGFLSYYVTSTNLRNALPIVFVVILFLSMGTIVKLTIFGYFENARWTSPDNHNCTVMWLGSQNMVVRCDGVISVEHQDHFSITTVSEGQARTPPRTSSRRID